MTAIRRSELFYGTGESYLFTFYPEFQVIIRLPSFALYCGPFSANVVSGHKCPDIMLGFFGVFLKEGNFFPPTVPFSWWSNVFGYPRLENLRGDFQFPSFSAALYAQSQGAPHTFYATKRKFHVSIFLIIVTTGEDCLLCGWLLNCCTFFRFWLQF